MDKDDELAQMQRKLKSQESEICQHQQHDKKFHKKNEDIKRRTSWKLRKSMTIQQAIPRTISTKNS